MKVAYGVRTRTYYYYRQVCVITTTYTHEYVRSLLRVYAKEREVLLFLFSNARTEKNGRERRKPSEKQEVLFSLTV